MINYIYGFENYLHSEKMILHLYQNEVDILMKNMTRIAGYNTS